MNLSAKRPKSNLSSSCSIRRLNLSSSCSNQMFPHRLPLKKLQSEPWQRLFDGEKKQIFRHQGLTMKKSKQSIDAIIDEEFFNLKDGRSSSNQSKEDTLPNEIQKHLDDLYEQIDDLVLQLSEERLNHQLARKQTEENFVKEFDKQNQTFQEFLHHQMIQHQQEIDQLTEEHSRKLNDEKTRYEGKEEQLHNQIEFLKSSFHSFKINLEKENEDNLQRRINEHVQKIRKESEEKDEEMKRKANDSILKEKKNLLAKHKIDLENIRKQHQQEIDTIHKNFANSAFDRTRVESLTKELTSTQLELEETKDRTVRLASKLKDLEIQHSQTMRDLNEFRTRFDEKTKEIERTYAGKLDRLHLDNADLRNMYLKKCAELVDERMLTQKKTQHQVMMTRKQLRQRLLNVRIASATPLITCATTTSQLDSTRRETKWRRRTSEPVTEEEQDIVRYLTSTPSTIRPNSSASASKYDFENERRMIENLSLEDLQQTFRGT